MSQIISETLSTVTCKVPVPCEKLSKCVLSVSQAFESQWQKGDLCQGEPQPHSSSWSIVSCVDVV